MRLLRVGTDSEALFRGKEIEKRDPSLSHLGEYHILYLDLTGIKGEIRAWQEHLKEEAARKGNPPEKVDWIQYIEQLLISECADAFGKETASFSLARTLENALAVSGRQFFWICDEWDLFLREECDDPCAPENYLELLRSLFKTSDGFITRVFAGAYLTGIMPMKVTKGESAVSSFQNYTMLAPGPLAPYIGFTAEEVKALCLKYDVSYQDMADWYDGYHFKGVGTIFNPRSVMEALRLRQFGLYWVQTGGSETIESCIERNLDGLWDRILQLLDGTEVNIEWALFSNDLTDLTDTNKVLTALTHLGYFSFSPDTGKIHIPNREIRQEFLNTLKNSTHAKLGRMVRDKR